MTASPNPTGAKPCQYIGMRNDPHAFYSYASIGNRCFHCLVPAAPRIAHQIAFCLGGAQNDCPVYKQPESKVFPPLLIAEDSLHPVHSRSTFWLPVLFIGIILVILVGSHYLPKYPGHPLVVPTHAAVPTHLPSVVPITPTDSPFPSATVIPTITGTPLPHALEVPVDIDGKEFLMHQVMGGETFEILAAKYNTNPDVIRALNYDLKPSLWANTVIVVSPGLQTVDPALPAFRAYRVSDATVTIDQLAAKLNVSSILIKQYNACTDVCHLTLGDWLIIPYPK